MAHRTTSHLTFQTQGGSARVGDLYPSQRTFRERMIAALMTTRARQSDRSDPDIQPGAQSRFAIPARGRTLSRQPSGCKHSDNVL